MRELTQDVLLAYLRSGGEVVDVDGVLALTVQPVVCPSFVVAVEARSTVRGLKEDIVVEQGVPARRQELFMLGGEGDAADTDNETTPGRYAVARRLCNGGVHEGLVADRRAHRKRSATVRVESCSRAVSRSA